MTDFDVLNSSWETFQRMINNHQTYSGPDLDKILVSSRLPSFQEIFDYNTNSEKSSEEDSSANSPIFNVFVCSMEQDDQNNMIDDSIFQKPALIPNIKAIKQKIPEIPKIKREKPSVFEKPQFIEVNVKNTPERKTIKSESKPTKKNVTNSPTKKRGETVRLIWWNNLGQIISNSMIPLRKCLYKFQNPSNCPWSNQEGFYIFEIHLLQVLCPKEAWNFKRYVDNHSKKAGEGQTFTLCSSIHKEEWNNLEMKSNKFFKKARMININAFKEKNGFITKGKWKYIFDLFNTEFENNVIDTQIGSNDL